MQAVWYEEYQPHEIHNFVIDWVWQSDYAWLNPSWNFLHLFRFATFPDVAEDTDMLLNYSNIHPLNAVHDICSDTSFLFHMTLMNGFAGISNCQMIFLKASVSFVW